MTMHKKKHLKYPFKRKQGHLNLMTVNELGHRHVYHYSIPFSFNKRYKRYKR